MIEVTPKATKLVTGYFKDKPKKPIRIFVKIGGCGMRSLGVVLEETTEADELFHIEGFSYVIDRKLLKKIQPVKVDSDGICFRLSGNGLYPPTGCGACPYMCGANGGKRCSGVCATCEDPCPMGQRKMGRKRKRRASKI
jgi:iron-sulfur cluster assembly protein